MDDAAPDPSTPERRVPCERFILAACVALILWKIGAVSGVGGTRPGLRFWEWRAGPIFWDTVSTGGDRGAHVWTPWFATTELLPHLRLTGWSMDWYAGFPVLSFYFPLPLWAIVAVGKVIPLNVAFKLVFVSGLVGLPIVGSLTARLTGIPRMYRTLFALGATVFVFDPHFEITGGNILSTMAGEFSFSIGVAFGLAFLGLLWRVLDTGRGRAAASLTLAAMMLSHLLPSIFFGASAVALCLVWIPGHTRRQVTARAVDAAVVAATAVLVTAFWIVPFYAHLPYTNDMGWERTTQFLGGLYPPLATEPLSDATLYGATFMGFAIAVAAIGGLVQSSRFVGQTRTRSPGGPDAEARLGTLVFLMAILAGLAFRFTPQFRLWNERALPFYFLSVYVLAGFGVVVLARATRRLLRRTTWSLIHADARAQDRRSAVIVAAAMLCWYGLGATLQILPAWVPIPKWDDGRLSIQRAGSTEALSYAEDWAVDGFKGYPSETGYPEFKRIMALMDRLGTEHGCGRAMWDYENELDRYGTSMGMMLLPMYTDGCIDSMEGLYFESSATTPYHFLNAAFLSPKASNPQSWLPYPTADLPTAVKHLQEFGVRYLMVFTPSVVAAARVDYRLNELATTPYERECSDEENTAGACPKEWVIFEIAGYELVQGLTLRPAVVTGIGQSQDSGWLDVATAQYMQPNAHPVPLAADGPKDWERVRATAVREGSYGDHVTMTAPSVKTLPIVSVFDIESDDQNVSFRVDRTGIPVVVRVSYFPNWVAKGAQGPWRLAPNLMVVVPTNNEVRLHYGRDGAERAGLVLSGLGLAVVAAFALSDRRRKRPVGGIHL